MSSSFQMWSATPAAIAARGDLGRSLSKYRRARCHGLDPMGVRVRCPRHRTGRVQQ
jgi:hypothetical protein